MFNGRGRKKEPIREKKDSREKMVSGLLWMTGGPVFYPVC